MDRLPSAVPRLTGDGFVLDVFLDVDVDALAVMGREPAIATWNPFPGTAEAQLRDWIARRNDWSDGEHASWAIRSTAGSVIGSVSLHHLDHDRRDAEIGYFVAADARGRGVATAAVQIASGYAFATLGMHRVYLYHAVENDASCRVAGRAAFVHEGTLRESHRYADGRYHDEHLHARLATDSPR